MAPTNRQKEQSKLKTISTGKLPKARIQRYLKETTEAKIVENPKATLLLKGIKCSQNMSIVLKDMKSMMAPHAKILSKNNVINAFDDEGQQSLEFLTTKNDCALFCMASHNKKRPNNLILGRTFDRRILDTVELGVHYYKSISDYSGVPKKRAESKPMLFFSGSEWHTNPDFFKLQNLLMDLYRGDVVNTLTLSGLDHLIVFTAASSFIGGVEMTVCHQRTYYCKLKKNPNGGRTPVPFLTASGPDMSFSLRRKEWASPDLWKVATKEPIRSKPKKTKNQTTNIFGETLGRLHLEKQDIDNMGGKKAKALKRAEKMEKEEEMARIEAELETEKSEMNKEHEQIFGFGEES